MGDIERTLAALGHVRALRTRLDEVEHALIASARHDGASWVRVAEALGLRSRQAAEQRWARLGGDTEARQQDVDMLRVALGTVRLRIAADPGWDDRHPRAALARATVDLACDAPTGAMFALATQALGDLDAVGDGLPDRSVRDDLREALRLLTVRPGARKI